jgi:hypothetical protein
MSWTGQIPCVVTNQTGGVITNFSVSHSWNGNTDVPNPNPTPQLADGATISFICNSGSGSSDEWTLTFTDVTGQCWTRSNKQCDIEQEDIGPNLAVLLNILNPSQGFSIETPVSDPCTDNSLDQC